MRTFAPKPKATDGPATASLHSQSPVKLQAKLAVSTQGDAYEQEADRIADQVPATSAPAEAGEAPPHIQRFSGRSNGASPPSPRDVPPSIDQALAGSGSPLEPGLRRDMEQRFGHDFSKVR